MSVCVEALYIDLIEALWDCATWIKVGCGY